MIDEIKILQEILGDLSSIGLNIVLAYIAFRVFIVLAWCWFAHHLIKRGVDIYKYTIKKELTESEDRFNGWKKGLESEHKIEMDEIKHHAKILKEKQNHEIEKLEYEVGRLSVVNSNLGNNAEGES